MGGRAYSLDTYPGPCSQGLIKFLQQGASRRMRRFREDVVKALAGGSRGWGGVLR